MCLGPKSAVAAKILQTGSRKKCINLELLVMLLGTSVSQGELGQFYWRQSGKALSRSWSRHWSCKTRKGS